MTNIIDEAKGICCGDRAAAYGHPIEAYTRVAKIWSAMLGVEISPRQVAVMMIGFKLGREAAKQNRDNLLDAIGYAWCADEIDRVTEKRDLPTLTEVRKAWAESVAGCRAKEPHHAE